MPTFAVKCMLLPATPPPQTSTLFCDINTLLTVGNLSSSEVEKTMRVR